MRKRISPKILIDYNRKPLVNKHGLYFRLTFDSQLKSSKTKLLFQNDNFFIHRYSHLLKTQKNHQILSLLNFHFG